MLKKIVGITLLMGILSVSAFAAIPRDQMHIGGLKLGMTLQQVTTVYGMPQAVNLPSKAARGMYEIAGGLIDGWIDDETNTFARYALRDDLTGASKINASGGITLGMTLTEVEQRLGKPDMVDPYGTKGLIIYKSVEVRKDGYPDNLLVYFSNGRVSSFTINVF